MVGDGSGGTEEYIGKTNSALECADLVRSTKPIANGATWGEQNCYAEFGASYNNGDNKWRTCLFEGK